MSEVVVVGSINTDLVVRAPRVPRPGETVLGGEFHQAGGGKGANQAVAAARAGARVTLVGRVGDDRLGAEACARLRADGVDVERVAPVAGVATGVALIVVADDGQNSIAVAPGANSRLTTAAVWAAEPVVAAASVLLVQLEVPLEAVLAASEIADAHRIPVVLDPAPARELPAELWGRLAVVTPNVTEAETLTGMAIRDQDDAGEAAARLRERGAAAAVVTLGAGGLVVATEDGVTPIPGHRVDACDTTAAGDVFAGALAVRLAEGANLLEAARFANAAAAVAVTRLGAQPSIPTRDEISERLSAPS